LVLALRTIERFGHTVLVQPNPSFQGPDAQCFRLTGRAVRVLKMLDVDTKG
jgi:hypothetical protein